MKTSNKKSKCIKVWDKWLEALASAVVGAWMQIWTNLLEEKNTPSLNIDNSKITRILLLLYYSNNIQFKINLNRLQQNWLVDWQTNNRFFDHSAVTASQIGEFAAFLCVCIIANFVFLSFGLLVGQTMALWALGNCDLHFFPDIL